MRFEVSNIKLCNEFRLEVQSHVGKMILRALQLPCSLFVKECNLMSDSHTHSLSRRKFLRGATAGTLAFSAPYVALSSARTVGYAKGTSVHPNIDELRVVEAHDEKMTEGTRGRLSWEQQESQVQWDRVQANMDRMACALVKEKDPERAWKSIFLKPPGKSWSETTVAIKSNHQGVQRARSAVVSKLCHVLTDIAGVSGANIAIYDGCHGGNMSKNTRFKKLPDGVKLANRWGSYNAKVGLPHPYVDGTGSSKCLDHLAKGEVDILIDLALTKRVMMWAGGFTQLMKNHFGTFNPRPGHAKNGHDDYLIAINKSSQILGKMDSSGKVQFPRQQLCMIDALWGSESGPGGTSTHQLNRLYMGNMAPVVDYQVATKLRADTMGWRINRDVTERFLTGFGYTADDLPNDGQCIDAIAYAG